MTRISNKIQKYSNTRFFNHIEEIGDMVEKLNETSTPMGKNIAVGFEQGTFFAGFVNPLKQLGFTDEMLTNIVVAKMTLEYQSEMTRMRFETEERIAEIYSSAQISMGYDPDI